MTIEEKKDTDEWFVMLFIMIQKVVQSFNSVHQIPQCGHSNECYKYLSYHCCLYFYVNRYFLIKFLEK